MNMCTTDNQVLSGIHVHLVFTAGVLKAAEFPAACWLYGRQLHDELRYPVGLISATFSPSSITDWMPPAVRDRCQMSVPYE